jgi:hypothetical protein
MRVLAIPGSLRAAAGCGIMGRMSTLHSALPALAAMLALGGCNAITEDKLKPADAEHWLHESCGVQLARPMQLESGSWMKASGSQGWHTRVTGNLHIGADEVDELVRQLRANTGLHQRGASATHFSFESLYRDHAERSCEIDGPTGRFYFQYVD